MRSPETEAFWQQYCRLQDVVALGDNQAHPGHLIEPVLHGPKCATAALEFAAVGDPLSGCPTRHSSRRAVRQRALMALARQASIIAIPRAPSSTVGKSRARGSQGWPAMRAAIASAASL